MAKVIDHTDKKPFTFGTKVKLENAPLFRDENYPTSHRTLSGTYYLYDGNCVNGRYKVVSSKFSVRFKPEIMVFIGWVKESDLGKI